MRHLTGAALFGAGLFVGLFGTAFVLHSPQGSSDWAAWAQAVGGGLGVTAAFLFPWRQAQREAELRRSETRSRAIAHSNALRVIAVESSEAVASAFSVIDRTSSSAIARFDATLTEFSATADDLFVRIATLTQSDEIGEEALVHLFEMRQILREVKNRLAVLRKPNRQLDALQRREMDNLHRRLLKISGDFVKSHHNLTQNDENTV